MSHDGVPCWAELATPDPDGSAAFYTAVLGWTVDGQGLARRAGRGVARLHAGDETAWTLYVAVDDADETCERIEQLGGTVLAPPEDGDDGRSFVALDTGGAELGGREADDPPPDRPGPGTLVGADAASAEPGQSRAFYQALFGFRFEPAERGTTIVHPDHGPIGTLDIAGDALPHWRVRFGVADLGAALAAVNRAGGSLVERSAESALVRDDGGAVIALVEVAS